MGVTFPNESPEYRVARNKLLQREVALRRGTGMAARTGAPWRCRWRASCSAACLPPPLAATCRSTRREGRSLSVWVAWH
jgi:hypothetical protein